MTNEEILALHQKGASEGAIVKQLGVTRHAVRAAITEGLQRRVTELEAKLAEASEGRADTRHEYFEQGRAAGRAELEDQLAASGKARAELEAKAEERPTRTLRGHQLFPVPDKSPFNEDLLAEMTACILAGKGIPEKTLRARYGVSHNAMYKYRAVAADRVQWGRNAPVAG